MTVKPPRVRKFIGRDPEIDIVGAMGHRGLFEHWFLGDSWDGWRSILRAAFCLPMSDDDREFFRTVAEREPPERRPRELWIVAGRRAGKDSIASLIAAYAAVFFYAPLERLRPGERALVQCLATDRDQARIVLNYIKSYFQHIPPLREMVVGQTVNGLELQNDVDIVVATNSFRAVRGRALLVSILDEVAFWMDERSSRPDTEVYNAIKPGMATLPDSMLIGISTGYRKSGLLWSKFKRHFGRDDDPDVLVVRAPSILLNPTLDEAIIAKAYDDDPALAASEWGGQFRDDIAAFIDPEAIEACVIAGRRELPPARGVLYAAFTDPSGGSSDSMTLAIGHQDNSRVVIDAVRERRPPFSPDDVVTEFAALLRLYSVGSVHGDRYAGEWCREVFRKYGIAYEIAEKPKSDLYRDLLPLLNSGRVELLDHPRSISQLAGLERRTARGGRDSIDHAPGAHDDLANCVAGVAALALGQHVVRITPELLAAVSRLPPRRLHPLRRYNVFTGG